MRRSISLTRAAWFLANPWALHHSVETACPALLAWKWPLTEHAQHDWRKLHLNASNPTCCLALLGKLTAVHFTFHMLVFVFHMFPFPYLERCLHFLRQSWKCFCSSMSAHFTQSALMGLSRVGNAEAIMQTCVKEHFHIEENIAVEIAQTKAITWTSLNCFCKMLSSWINSFAASSSCNVYWPLSQIAISLTANAAKHSWHQHFNGIKFPSLITSLLPEISYECHVALYLKKTLHISFLNYLPINY